MINEPKYQVVKGENGMPRVAVTQSEIDEVKQKLITAMVDFFVENPDEEVVSILGTGASTVDDFELALFGNQS